MEKIFIDGLTLHDFIERVENIVHVAVSKSMNEVKKEMSSTRKSNDLLSGKQVQELFGISASSLYNYTRIGMIECFKMGRLNRYSEKQIKSVLTKSNTGGK